jgi:hypothetical protein
VYGDIGETESCEDRPHLATVNPAGGHRVLDPLDDLGYSCAGKEGMRAEEERVEYGSKDRLVNCDLSLY